MGLFKKNPPKTKEAPPIDGKQAEIGVSTTSLYGAKDITQYNPDSLLWNKGYGVYKKMLEDDQVKAVMLFKQYAVVSREWTFGVENDPDTGEPIEEQQEMADFFTHCIQQMKGAFIDNLLEILSALKFGFSLCEKIYDSVEWNEKAYWGLRDIKLRPYETFDGGFHIDKHGNIVKITQEGENGQEIEIPLEKIIHFVHQPDIDRRYGESDLRSCYRAWWSKDIAIKFQNIHLERHAGGFVWAKVTGPLDPTQKQNLQNLIDNISARMGAMVPEHVDLNSINPMSTDAFDKSISQHDKSIAKSLLVPNLLGLSEQGSTGSYSQSQTQIEAFFWVLDSISKKLAEVLNEQLFEEIALWNFNTTEYPRFKFEPISDEAKIKLVTTWRELVKDGAATKTESDEKWVREMMGAPEKSEEGLEEMPEDSTPADIPDNEDWLITKTNQAEIRREFEEQPWLLRVNFAKLEHNFDSMGELLTAAMSATLATTKLALEKQISKVVGQRSMGFVEPKEIEGISMPKAHATALRKALRKHLTDALNVSYEMARRELPRRKFKQIQPGMDKTKAERYLASKSLKIAGVMSDNVNKAVQTVLENGIQYDKSLKDIMAAMSEDTNLVSMLPEVDAAGRAINVPARLENIARTEISRATNTARQALFTSPELRGFVKAFEYSAILDMRTTEICNHLSGKILKDFGHWQPPNHFQCRSILVPVTVLDQESGDWNGKQSPRPRVDPQKGFG